MQIQQQQITLLPIDKWGKFGMYDSQHPQKKEVIAYKVIDISDFCPKLPQDMQAVIKYAKITEGVIFQLCTMYKKGEDLGVTIKWNLNQVDSLVGNHFHVFDREARLLGIESHHLAKLIKDHSNPPGTERMHGFNFPDLDAKMKFVDEMKEKNPDLPDGVVLAALYWMQAEVINLNNLYK